MRCILLNLNFIVLFLLPVYGEEIAKKKDNVMPKALVEMLLDQYIFDELDLKDKTIPEACDTMNKVINKHLDDLGHGLVFKGVVPDKSSKHIKKAKVFIHIKSLTLRTVIKLITEQTGTQILVQDGGVMILNPDTD